MRNKNALRTALRLVPLVFLLAVIGSAADLTGVWKGTFDFQGTAMPLTLNLKTAENAVSGTVEGLPTTPADIHDGKIDGDNITFWVVTDYNGTSYKLVYKGKVASNQIQFTFGTEDGSFSTDLLVKKS